MEKRPNVRNRRNNDPLRPAAPVDLGSLIDTVPGVVFQFYARDDGSYSFHYIGKQSRTVLGIEPDPATFHDESMSRVLSEDRGGVVSSIDEAVREVREWRQDYRFVKPSGETIWIRGHSVPVQTESGIVFNGVLLDITEEKQIDEALRESRQRLNDLVDAAPYGAHAYEFLPDGSLVFTGANRSANEILGVDHAQFVGRTIEDAFPALVKTPIPEAYRRVAQTGEPYEEEQTEYDEQGISGAYDIHAFRIGPNRMAVFFRDITERKKAEQALLMDESRLEALLELSQMQHASVQDLTAFAMEEAVRLTGSAIGYVAFVTDDEQTLAMYSWSRQAMAECAVDNKPLIYPVETTGLWGEAIRQRKPIITNDYTAPNPWKKGYPKGHVHVTRHMNVPVFDGDKVVVVAGVGNKPIGYDESDVRQLTLLMDGMWRIIQRNRSEEQIRKVNRTLRVLSDCNQALIRAKSEADLLRNICEVIVRVGGYRMAWIGFAENDESRTVRPAAHAGFEDGYLGDVRLSWADDEFGHGPTGTAIRTGEPAFCRDILTDPQFAPWRDNAARRGYVSSVAVPLLSGESAIGVLVLYSDKSEELEDEEISLLVELASDLSYGIIAQRTREEHRRAEEELTREKAFSDAVLDSIPGLFYVYNDQGRLVRWNKKHEELTGYSADELAGKRVMEWFEGEEEDTRIITEAMGRVAEDGQADAEAHLIAKNGGTILFHFTGVRMAVDQRQYLVGIGIDITESRRAEEALRKSEDEKRQFYRDTISSVTGGALEIVDRTDIEAFERDADLRAKISSFADTSLVRKTVENYSRSTGLDGDGLGLFITGLGEAMTNAVKHASGGRVYAGIRGDELWVGVCDTGSGIGALTIPKATLRRGYSTKASMGMGYSIMLEVADRVMLSTGPEGTSVLLFKRISGQKPAVSLDALPDTWKGI